MMTGYGTSSWASGIIRPRFATLQMCEDPGTSGHGPLYNQHAADDFCQTVSAIAYTNLHLSPENVIRFPQSNFPTRHPQIEAEKVAKPTKPKDTQVPCNAGFVLAK